MMRKFILDDEDELEELIDEEYEYERNKHIMGGD